MKERYERRARNEALIREVNDRIEEVDRKSGGEEEDRFDFLCECGREPVCNEIVERTLAEYKEVREQDDRFAVFPGHETERLERVVRQNGRYSSSTRLRRRRISSTTTRAARRLTERARRAGAQRGG